VLEQGKPYREAYSDVMRSSDFALSFSEYELLDTQHPSEPQSAVWTAARPLGVVAAIVPWNYPFYQSAFKMVHALHAGNTVVIKPAPTTPLSALHLGYLIADILPAGVVNILGDDGSVGPALVEHELVAKVSFTGSTETGKKVMASAAKSLKRVTLELGGNDAAIVLEDADPIRAAQKLAAASFRNAGQVCISSKRMYVQGSIYDDFLSSFIYAVEQLRVGHGLHPKTDVGPVQNSDQFAQAREWLEVAAKDGTVVAGGGCPDVDGFFVEPTLVAHVRPESKLMREEVFAPIRSVTRFDDVADAVAQANGTPYGLGASIWTDDTARAKALAVALDAGTVWINGHAALRPDVPYGGVKHSGIGREFGLEGLRSYTDTQAVYLMT
jgi:acyl-CoA reductase-like NAD-dependent aldehyde dehydrogenase